ncbi:hypothetical protein BDZ89DRAFT_210585 [Hymenopellis radicata]|nr:hypothetical protein BDZ89DRAFT_210585 [Hymenopellis radicata]
MWVQSLPLCSKGVVSSGGDGAETTSISYVVLLVILALLNVHCHYAWPLWPLQNCPNVDGYAACPHLMNTSLELLCEIYHPSLNCSNCLIIRHRWSGTPFASSLRANLSEYSILREVRLFPHAPLEIRAYMPSPTNSLSRIIARPFPLGHPLRIIPRPCP